MTTTRTYRWPDDLYQRLRAHKERLERQTGVELAETQVVLSLVRRALDEVEAEAAATKTTKRK